MMPETVTIEQAARRLGIGRNTAYNAARAGDLPAIRIGRRLVVPVRRLDQLLSGATGPAVSEPAGDTR